MKTGIIKIYMQKYHQNKRIYTLHRLFAVRTNICQVVSVVQSQNNNNNNNNNNKTQWQVSKFAVAIPSINFHAYGFVLVGQKITGIGTVQLSKQRAKAPWKILVRQSWGKNWSEENFQPVLYRKDYKSNWNILKPF